MVESDEDEAPGQTYNEEQRQLKEELKRALDEGPEEEEILTLRDKTAEDQVCTTAEHPNTGTVFCGIYFLQKFTL